MIEDSTKVLYGFGLRAMDRGAMAVLCTLVLLASVSLLRAGTGTVDMATGWYVAGANITATAMPEQFSEFDGWGGDTNGAFITNKQITVVVTNPLMITAVFSEKRTVSGSVPHRWLAAQDIAWTNDFEWAVTNDYDDDGYSNGKEYWSGTDPKTNTSYLHISSFEQTVTNVRLSWVHSQIGTYKPEIVVQSSESMNPVSWSNAAVRSVTNGVNSWGVQKDQKSTFFKLSVTNMP